MGLPMFSAKRKSLAVMTVSLLLGGVTGTAANAADLSFFITSAGPGNGANLGANVLRNGIRRAVRSSRHRP